VPTTTIVPRSSDPVVALAQQYDGLYVGTFTNTTFNTTGNASLEVRVLRAADTFVDKAPDGAPDLRCRGRDLSVDQVRVPMVALGATRRRSRRPFGALDGKEPHAAVGARSSAHEARTQQRPSFRRRTVRPQDEPVDHLIPVRRSRQRRYLAQHLRDGLSDAPLLGEAGS
jgi:hypothetical protein